MITAAVLLDASFAYSQIADIRVNSDADGVVVGIGQSETTVAVGNAVTCIAYNDRVGLVKRNGFAASGDGVSFSDGGSFPTPSPVDGFDPTLAFRAADAQFYFVAVASLTVGLVVLRSMDCQAWNFLGRINRTTPGTLKLSDRPMLAIDNSASSPRFGRLFVAFLVQDNLTQALRVRVAWSDNPASPPEPVDNWSNISDVALPVPGWVTQAPWVATAPNGDVYVAFVEYETAHGGQQTIRISRSTDGGAIWQPPTPIATGRRAGNLVASHPDRCGRPALNGDIRISGSPQIAIHPDPALPPPAYVIHASYFYDSDGEGPDESNAFYRRSTNQGGEWSAQVQLNQDNPNTPTDQWSPALAVSASGVVAATWYDRRNDPSGNWRFDRYLSMSDDGGITWRPNVRLSDLASKAGSTSPVSRNLPPYGEGTSRCYHGDYDQVAVDAGGLFHVAWSDDRRLLPTGGCPSDDPNYPSLPYFVSSCPNPDVYYNRIGDIDGDGLRDAYDTCPTVPNPVAADADGDGVDDVCDTCGRQPDFNNDVLQLGPNPAFGGSMTNRTTVSGQLDDDADGIGNHCDFDYNNQGAVITATDFNDMKFSLLPSPGLMTQSNCGGTAAEGGSGDTQRCGEFDHDGAGAVVGVVDFNKAKAAVAGLILVPQETMACGDPCKAPFSGPIGSGNEVLGKAIMCEGVACQ